MSIKYEVNMERSAPSYSTPWGYLPNRQHGFDYRCKVCFKGLFWNDVYDCWFCGGFVHKACIYDRDDAYIESDYDDPRSWVCHDCDLTEP